MARSMRGLLLVALVMVLASACGHRRMHTARQLDKDSSVVSAAFEEPGHAFLPRASVQGVFGLGEGDANVLLGTTGTTASFGTGGRYYINDFFQAELHTLYHYSFLEANSAGSPSRDAFISRLGLSTSVTPTRKVYGQTNLNAYVYGPASEEAFAAKAFIHTMSIGFETDTGDDVSVQLEFTVPTSGWTTRTGFTPPVGEIPMGATQFGVAVNWR